MGVIYQIINLQNNKIYIGSAKDFYHRTAVHLSQLRKNKHHNYYLQQSYNKYGEENFLFESLISCPDDLLLYYEQQFLDQAKPEYNICKIAGNTQGCVVSLETRIKLSISHKGKNTQPKSEEHRRKLSESHIGIGHKHTEEEKRKISESHTGKTHSKEHNENIGKTKLGNKYCVGRILSDETKKKISDAHILFHKNKKKLDDEL